MLDIEQINDAFEKAHPRDILIWAWQAFRPGIVATSSFQTQSVPLLHMISQVVPELPVLFLDTGFHFSETLAYRDLLIQNLSVNVRVIKPELEPNGFVQKYGELYRVNPDLCCFINKVEPLQRAMAGMQAWISGIRSDQTTTRSRVRAIEQQEDGRYKISPLIKWSSREIWQYIQDNHLPEHPLLSQGYLSIGCAPCTRPVREGEAERSGRWAGQCKTECGLHITKPAVKD